MATMTKALRAAARAVSPPCLAGYRWHVYGPHDDARPDGASETRCADSYALALALRTQWVAAVALLLLGHDRDDVARALPRDNPTTARAIVRSVHAELSREVQP